MFYWFALNIFVIDILFIEKGKNVAKMYFKY